MSDIQYVYPLIHNKVTSPHYVTPTLRRARLLDWLTQNSGCRAVVVAADAGYGKTTLLWQWEREVNFPCYWYKLDRHDRDWSLHISYLIEAINQRHPGFGRRAHSMLQQLGGPGSSRPGVAAYLLAEMHERLKEPCTFIIDDWQVVASVTEVRGLWNQILRDAPPTCRFIFLSRAKPHLQLARFKTHSGYAELRTDALRFTDHEIEELFRDIYSDPLGPTELSEVERRTEGWPASLQLIEVSLRERLTPEDRRAALESIASHTDSDLMEYLAQEVLDQQPERVRTFLLATSILQQIEPELAGRLAGVADGAEVLADLESRGLFTNRIAPEEQRYRYHGLFRAFLQRNLDARSAAGEVAALHIHAGSYYETHERWPEAIHHYLAAGLQPQAARLIAKYGDNLISAGRIPLVDEWIAEMPERTVRENARLSLLYGETTALRGNWEAALRSLARARTYFAKKGDRRMEALACSKLSGALNNLGEIEKSAAAARDGLRLAPDDAYATRIRLRGNLVTTTTMLNSIELAEVECKKVAAESYARGYEHFAAIANHNIGIMARWSGHLEESAAYLSLAARFWNETPSSPFADNSELATTLVLQGEADYASSAAESAIARNAPRAKPQAEARYGLARVKAYSGDYGTAISILSDVLSDGARALGPVGEKARALLMECLYLADAPAAAQVEHVEAIAQMHQDPRLGPSTSVAYALGQHQLQRCSGECVDVWPMLDRWTAAGAGLQVLLSAVALALLTYEHDGAKAVHRLRSTLEAAVASPARKGMKWWLRRYAEHMPVLLPLRHARDTLPRLVELDAATWTAPVIRAVDSLDSNARAASLSAIVKFGDSTALDVLSGSDSAEIRDVHRQLMHRFAEPIMIRSFGKLRVLRGGWDGTPVQLERKRLRLLLGLLVANAGKGLSRDELIEQLWPDSELGAAINSLNQAVFQLRRVFDPLYREGSSPQYIFSATDAVFLNPELVSTDVYAVRQIASRLQAPTATAARAELAASITGYIQGQYLADLKYEDWANRAQLTVHAEVRAALLPIAQGDGLHPTDPTILAAGSALTMLDPYDETAHVAIARHLAQSGRRRQARAYIESFVARLRSELDEEPSEAVQVAAALVGATFGSISI